MMRVSDMSEKFRSEIIQEIANILGDSAPRYIGDTETYDIAIARSPLGVFIIGVFDTSPRRTVIIGQLPNTADVKRIEKEIERITDKYPSSYDDVLRELVELMLGNDIAFVELECSDGHCRPAE